ncbi:MAG: hypothetical protein Fur0022_03280 [Anaerolineales bacterium]
MISDLSMKTLENRIAQWAATRSEIRLILVVGSRARKSPPADEWAELDLHLFCTYYDHLISELGWLQNLGEVWTWLSDELEEDVMQKLVLFEGGHKVDFAFHPLKAAEKMVTTQQLDEIYLRGFYPLLDKDAWSARLPPAPFTVPRHEKPTEEQFQRVVHAFWYGAVYVAKQIRQGNLWVAKYRDWTMKTGLLQMMEWHAWAVHGWEFDTFHDGHFLTHWTDAQTLEALEGVFGRFNPLDSWQALLNTMALFRRLTTQTALVWKFDAAKVLDQQVTAFVHHLYHEVEKNLVSRSNHEPHPT